MRFSLKEFKIKYRDTNVWLLNLLYFDHFLHFMLTFALRANNLCLISCCGNDLLNLEIQRTLLICDKGFSLFDINVSILTLSPIRLQNYELNSDKKNCLFNI